MDRLDTYEQLPSGMREYLSNYGWHFSKKLCEHAVSKMRDKNGKISPYTNDQIHQMLKANGIELKNDVAYDACYVANMAKADYWGSSITSEQANTSSRTAFTKGISECRPSGGRSLT